MNLGNLMRSAHAFGASFFFAVEPHRKALSPRSDTSRSGDHLPLHLWPSAEEMKLPEGCDLVGIELLAEAVDLPSFRHPIRAAYVLGPERGELSPAMLERCRYVIRVPSAFCINVATAGAIVMYDRLRSLGRFADRPVRPGGPTEAMPEHVHGAPPSRSEGR